MSIVNTETAALANVRQLAARLLADAEFVATLEALQARSEASFEGVWGASSALLAAALVQRCEGQLVVVCPVAESIDKMCDDLALFSAAEPLLRP